MQGTRHRGFCRFSSFNPDHIRYLSNVLCFFWKKRFVDPWSPRTSTHWADSLASPLCPKNLGRRAAPETQGCNKRFPSEPIQTNSKRQIPATARMILKGQESFVDAYSCFFDNLKQVLNMFLHLHWKSIIQKLPRGLEDFNRSHLNVQKHSHIPPRTSRYWTKSCKRKTSLICFFADLLLMSALVGIIFVASCWYIKMIYP